MIRSLGLMVCGTVLALGLGGARARGQQAAASAQSAAGFPGKAELQRRIALYEDAQRNAELTHPGLESMRKIYSNLTALYVDAGMFAKAQAVTRRQIAMLRSGPQNELADAMGQMATVHIVMGDMRAAEKDDEEALRIRESVGDPVGIALTSSDLADVYIKQNQYKKALDLAQRAVPALADDPKVDVGDRIAAQETLAYALCGMKRCGQAIPLLKETLEMGAKAYGPDSLLVGAGKFVLGYVYWQNGDMDDAGDLMATGIARMRVDLGWGHVIYLNAMIEYAKFLRQRGQVEEAAAAEREIKMANAVVDVRSLAPSASAFANTVPQ